MDTRANSVQSRRAMVQMPWRESDAVLGAILARDFLSPFSSEWVSWIRPVVTTLYPVQSSAEKVVGTDTFLGILPPGRGDWTILRRVKSMTCGSFVNHRCTLLPTCSTLLISYFPVSRRFACVRWIDGSIDQKGVAGKLLPSVFCQQASVDYRPKLKIDTSLR